MKVEYKEFKKSRVCVIDSFPILLKSIQEVCYVCEQNNIPFNMNGRGSTLVQNIFYHFCIDNIFQAYSLCKSSYPKVLVVYPYCNNKRGYQVANEFVKSKIFEKILKIIPFPHCKCSVYNDKEVEAAAISIVEKHKISYDKITKFANVKKLTNILSKFKNQKDFSHGYVSMEGQVVENI